MSTTVDLKGRVVPAAPQPGDVVVVLVTAPDERVARGLADTLVAEHLVACAALLPGVTSVYRWQGKVEAASEVQLLLKTTAARIDDVTARVASLHPYELPEILALPVLAGLPAYLRWVVAETASSAP